MDWESDPELRLLRAEFMGSFQARRKALQEILPGLAGTAPELQKLTHALAGAAGSYGLVVISEISGAIDDYLDLGTPEASMLTRFASLLLEALESAERSGRDPEELRQDPRYRELICAAGSPVS